jgi:hypothetical protein
MEEEDELSEGERDTLNKIREKKKKMVAGAAGAEGGPARLVGCCVGGAVACGQVDTWECHVRPHTGSTPCHQALNSCLPPLLRAEHRRKKSVGNNHCALPRAVDPERSRTKERMQKELGEMGLDAVAASERAARSQSRRGRSLVRKRGRSAADADMAEAEAAPQKRIHSSKSRCAEARETGCLCGWEGVWGVAGRGPADFCLPAVGFIRIPPSFYTLPHYPTSLLQVDVSRTGAQHCLPRPQQGPQGRRAAQQVHQDGGCVGACSVGACSLGACGVGRLVLWCLGCVGAAQKAGK